MSTTYGKNNAGIYCRLSVDAGAPLSQSQSIENQKNILTKYCIEQGFNIYDIYIDDGFSGTTFTRPALNKLKQDIELGYVNIVVTKDLSRLGRDYIEMGIFLERFFPDNNIRYIALNDNVDTLYELDDYLPLKSVINELYAKDISKKIRTTQKYQRENGIYRQAAKPLYGYIISEDKNKRMPNPETVPIVQKIYEMVADGHSIKGILQYLEKNKVLTPTSYNLSKEGLPLQANPYKWNYTTIRSILTNEEYLGYYIKGKTTKRFKSKRTINISKDEQYKFKDVFEPIISKEMFNFIQTMLNGTRNNTQLTNLYYGLVFCGICHKPLRFIRHKSSSGVYEERLYCTNANEPGKGSIKINDLNEYIKNEVLLKNNTSFKSPQEITDANKLSPYIIRKIISKIIISTSKKDTKCKLEKNIEIHFKQNKLEVLCS